MTSACAGSPRITPLGRGHWPAPPPSRTLTPRCGPSASHSPGQGRGAAGAPGPLAASSSSSGASPSTVSPLLTSLCSMPETTCDMRVRSAPSAPSRDLSLPLACPPEPGGHFTVCANIEPSRCTPRTKKVLRGKWHLEHPRTGRSLWETCPDQKLARLPLCPDLLWFCLRDLGTQCRKAPHRSRGAL